MAPKRNISTATAEPAPSSMRSVEVVVYLMLLARALLLGYDNWRSGMALGADGPQAGYLPFYLCVILRGRRSGACVLVVLRRRSE